MTVKFNPEAFEDYIDRHGVEVTLDTIAMICHEKADHIESSYDDRALANRWRRVAKAIETASAKASTIDLRY